VQGRTLSICNRRIGYWIILGELVLFFSSTVESPDVLRFDAFCITSRVCQLKFFVSMVYVLWCEAVRTVVAYRGLFQVCSCENMK